MQAELTEQKDGAKLGGGGTQPCGRFFLGTLWYVY